MVIFEAELRVDKILENAITGRFDHHLATSCPKAGRCLELKFLSVFYVNIERNMLLEQERRDVVGGGGLKT
jgi:hypothetical protein